MTMINVPLPPMIDTVTMACSGFAFGLVYFAALERTVALLASKRGWLGPFAFTLGRIMTAVFFLGLTAKLGALFLLVAFLGFLLERAVSLRVAGRTS